MELTQQRSPLPLSPSLVALGLFVGIAVPLIPWLGLVTATLLMICAFVAVAVILCADSIDLFSPGILFTLLWTLCACIGAQIVSIQQQPWNTTVWICVVGAPIALWTGDLTARALLHSPGAELGTGLLRVAPMSLRPVVLWGVIWWGLALLATAYEFKVLIGGVPLLMENWETARMLGGEGYVGRLIHATALSVLGLAALLQVALLSQRRLLSLASLPLWGLWSLTVGLAALWGSRHMLFIPFAAGAISLHLMRVRLGALRLLALGALGLAALGFIAYVRTSMVWDQETDLSWDQVLGDIGYGGWNPLLAQVHQTVAINFEIFRRLTATIPDFAPYHLGGYTFHWLWSLLPGTQLTLAQWQNEFWNTQFYGSLTSTHMGPLYADFGVAGVFIWTAVFGLIMRMLYIAMRRSPSPAKIVWFSFLTVQLIMMPYDNTMVKLAFWLQALILSVGLIALGAHRSASRVEACVPFPLGTETDVKEST